MDINISNVTTRTLTVSLRALIAEIQLVAIQDPHTPEEANGDTFTLVDQVKTNKDILISEQLEGNTFILDCNDKDEGQTTCEA